MHCNPPTRHTPVATVIAAIFALGLADLAPRPAAAEDKIPNLNVEPSCRYQSRMQDDKQAGYQNCMEQEKTAKAQLEKTWSQYSAEDRKRCLDMTNELGGSTASYVEVLECVIMTKDAHAFEKKFPSDMDISIGQGK